MGKSHRGHFAQKEARERGCNLNENEPRYSHTHLRHKYKREIKWMKIHPLTIPALRLSHTLSIGWRHSESSFFW